MVCQFTVFMHDPPPRRVSWGNIPPTEYIGADFEIYRNVTCKTEHNRTFPKKMTASLSSERGASSCADSCFDSWINFPASTIKRAVFLFSSSTLRRNKADSSSCCDLAITPVLLSSIDWPPMRIIRLHKRPTPKGTTAEGCVRDS